MLLEHRAARHVAAAWPGGSPGAGPSPAWGKCPPAWGTSLEPAAVSWAENVVCGERGHVKPPTPSSQTRLRAKRKYQAEQVKACCKNRSVGSVTPVKAFLKSLNWSGQMQSPRVVPHKGVARSWLVFSLDLNSLGKMKREIHLVV